MQEKIKLPNINIHTKSSNYHSQEIRFSSVSILIREIAQLEEQWITDLNPKLYLNPLEFLSIKVVPKTIIENQEQSEQEDLTRTS